MPVYGLIRTRTRLCGKGQVLHDSQEKAVEILDLVTDIAGRIGSPAGYDFTTLISDLPGPSPAVPGTCSLIFMFVYFLFSVRTGACEWHWQEIGLRELGDYGSEVQ